MEWIAKNRTDFSSLSHFKNIILACDLSLNLKCFNFFNYGQLLVHSRALLCSRIAYVTRCRCRSRGHRCAGGARQYR